MRWPWAAVPALVWLAVSCTGRNHAPDGTVVGEYRLVGGPAPGVNEPYPGTIWAYTGSIGWARAKDARAFAHVSTDAAGRFSMSLPPGRYTLLGAGGGSLDSSGCGSPTVVDVLASARVVAHLWCSVP